MIWQVTVTSADGSTETFETTDEHPWWVDNGEGGEAWLRTDELSAGMVGETQSGEAITIASVIKTGQLDGTYNITVADFHTYFVGETKVLVHNCDELKFMHNRDLYDQPGVAKSSFDYWSNKSTDDILRSLELDGLEPLVVRSSDGMIMNGNTRLHVLKSRGVDINKIPRTPYP